MKNQYHFALIGEQVGYSQSPDIFEAIFKHSNATGRFDVLSVERDQLSTRVRQLMLDGIRGFSVTIPYKEEIIQYLDDIGPVAQALGAVNSIWVEGDQLYGYNTDCHGFSVALEPYRSRLCPEGVLVLGCGGAARAAIYALYKDYDIRHFTVAGRSSEKLKQVKESLQARIGCVEINPVSMNSNLRQVARDMNLIVNCTPLGGWSHRDSGPLPEDFDFSGIDIYYDLNYNRDNRCIRAARDAKIIAIDGSAMLVAQAIRSYDIWTGQSVAFQPIYDAVFSAG